MRTRLRSLLASLQPAELVLRKAGEGHSEPGAPSSTTLKVCNPRLGNQCVEFTHFQQAPLQPTLRPAAPP